MSVSTTTTNDNNEWWQQLKYHMLDLFVSSLKMDIFLNKHQCSWEMSVGLLGQNPNHFWCLILMIRHGNLNNLEDVFQWGGHIGDLCDCVELTEPPLMLPFNRIVWSYMSNCFYFFRMSPHKYNCNNFLSVVMISRSPIIAIF